MHNSTELHFIVVNSPAALGGSAEETLLLHACMHDPCIWWQPRIALCAATNCQISPQTTSHLAAGAHNTITTTGSSKPGSNWAPHNTKYTVLCAGVQNQISAASRAT